MDERKYSAPFRLWDMDEDAEKEFREWRKDNGDVLKNPIVQSLLYDLNRLPEVVLTFKSMTMASQATCIVEHFKRALAPPAEPSP